MADDELLREALLELQFLREREAATLEATNTLVDCLEAYSQAPSAGDALASVFVSLAQKLGADLSLVCAAAADGAVRAEAASDQAFLDQTFELGFDVFARPRHVASLATFSALPPSFSPFGAMIVAPVRDDLALLTFRKTGAQFKKADTPLVQRLAGLAAQALRDRELSARNDLLAATIAGSSSGFAIADAGNSQKPLIYVNQAFEELSGYTAAEVLGQNCRFLSDEAPDAPERVRLRAAVKSNARGTFLLRNRRKSGDLFWNELTLFPVTDASGTVRTLVATQTDVTERVEAAAARDQVRGWMDSALTATEDAFLVLDATGVVALANRGVRDLFPAAPLDWQSGTQFADNWTAYIDGCKDLPGKVTRLLRDADFAALADLPSGFELDLPDGRSALVRANRLDDGGLVVSATDVTAIKSAQNLLAQRLSAIEAASDGIATTDPAGRLTYLNSAAARLLGFDAPAQGLGRKWRDRYADMLSEDPDTGTMQFSIEVTNQVRVGTHEVSATALATGGAVIVIRDETARLDQEAREDQLQQDLIRLQGQEAVAQLTAGIAHDFNNLLSVINGSATLIDMQSDLPDPTRAHVRRILSAGTQSSKLISRLLDVGASDEATGAFDLGSVLTDLPDLVRPALLDGQCFAIDADTPPVTLRGTAGTLSQIVINLIFNARDALSGAAGEITLGVAMVETAPQDVAVGQVNPALGYAALSVTDTGSGMDAKTAEAMFDPYFTTKGAKGTGLGLATAAMQMRALGGAIGVTSVPGQGTTLTLYWPQAGAAQTTPQEAPSEDVDLTGLTLLVVDDEPDVSTVVAGYLEAQGAEVAQCQDPRDAQEAIAEDPGAWSALITDYDMPQMTGGALVAAIRDAAPALPVYVITALAKRLSDPRLTTDQVQAIWPKPVDLVQLAQALAQLKDTG